LGIGPIPNPPIPNPQSPLTISKTIIARSLFEILSKTPSPLKNYLFIYYILASTMKSNSGLILKEITSGTEMTTPGIPPNSLILASTSPIDLLTASFPGLVLYTSADLFPGEFSNLSDVYTNPPAARILCFSLSFPGLWSIDKGCMFNPRVDDKTARESPKFAT
jgi:hypothetical protein